GLMGDERRPEQARGLALHVGDRADHLDAAGLAASAGVNLRLDHPHRAAEIMGALGRIRDREGGNAARHRNAELAQHRPCLVLVNAPRPRAGGPRGGGEVWGPGRGAILRRASTGVRPAVTDLSNISRSAPLSSISTTRSTPLAPIPPGTPT